MHTQAEINTTRTNLDFEPRFSLEKGIKTYISEIQRLHGSKNL